MVLIILACSIVAALLLMQGNKPTRKKQVKVDRNEKYKIPAIFWDEFNWLQMKINKMQRSDADTVQARINEFIYKYEQYIEFKVFNEKVAELLANYQKKVSSLLNNKHLEHGTSV